MRYFFSVSAFRRDLLCVRRRCIITCASIKIKTKKRQLILSAIYINQRAVNIYDILMKIFPLFFSFKIICRAFYGRMICLRHFPVLSAASRASQGAAPLSPPPRRRRRLRFFRISIFGEQPRHPEIEHTSRPAAERSGAGPAAKEKDEIKFERRAKN